MIIDPNSSSWRERIEYEIRQVIINSGGVIPIQTDSSWKARIEELLKILTYLIISGGTVANNSITNLQIAANAEIAWSKLSKVGAVPSDVGAASIAQGLFASTALQPATIGVSVQAFNGQLATIAALAPTSGQFLRRGVSAWQSAALVAGDIPVLDVAKITTGLFDNARINWAAPGEIGLTPNTASFTTLALSGAATVKNLTSTGTRIGLAPTSAPPGGGFRYDFTAAASVSWVSVGPSSNLQFGHGASGNNSSGLWNSGGSLALQFDVTANTNQGSVLIGTATNNGADKLQVAGNASVAGNFTASGTSHTIGANTNTSTFLGLNGAAGSTRQMLWRTAGLNRWNLYADIGTEAGSNTGSLMTLSYYNDAGGYIGDIFTATRLGVFTFTAPTARFTGANLGFFNATPAAKPTVTGSKGGNAALASLITALATLGLVTDTTT